jgi:D-lyxose ketol-isomerase
MKRSEANRGYRDALACFARHGWALPPRPRWDITDFGLGEFDRVGLVLLVLCEEPEYCEKLMYAREGQTTPCHAHARKKEDIICRAGSLSVRLWGARPDDAARAAGVKVDGEIRTVGPGEALVLPAGSRVTLAPGTWHEFAPLGGECILGEVSTANDDVHDNLFLDPAVGRFPGIEEDEPALVRLVGD